MKLDYISRQEGLTLIETLVVIVILGIIAMIAVPRIQLLLAKQEMQKVTILIPHIIRQAKYEAFLHRKDVVICPSVDGKVCTNYSLWQDYILMFVDNNKNRQKDSHEQLLRSEVIQIKYATITRLGARHANYMMFKQSNALPQGSQGSFYYCSLINQSLNRRIILNGMGWYRIENIETCN